MASWILPFCLCMHALGTFASILFSGGTVIAFDKTTESLQVFRNGSVLVENDRISQVINDTSSIFPMPPDTEIVNVSGKILTPGFVDTHHHLWQSLFKTLESNDSLATYFTLFGETGPAETNFTTEDSYISQLGGALESLNAGVTTIVDHAHGLWSNDTADAILQADIDSGARIHFAFAIHPLTNNWTIQDQMAKFQAMATQGLYLNTTTSLGIAYDHFVDGAASQTDAVVDLAIGNNVSVVTSHCVGGPFKLYNGPEILSPFGILNTSIPIIISHASYLTAEGMAILRATNQYIACTPESELQLGFDTHNVTRLIQDQAALGVDTNFGFSADIIGQARLWLQRLRGLNYEDVLDEGLWPSNNPMSANQAFLLATRHGGLALRRNDIGTIAAGAKADLVVFDTTKSASFLGWNDPVAAVMLHAGIGDIEHVLVDGKFVKRDGKLTYQDYAGVAQRFARSAERIQSSWAEILQPLYSDGGGYEYGLTEQVDTQRGDGTGYGDLEVEG